jgi:hypothetical protein
VTDHDGDNPSLTTRQRLLLNEIRISGARFLSGADVRVARTLAAIGLVTLEDNGAADVRRNDGERWWCTLGKRGPAEESYAVTDEQIKSLSMGGEIDLDTACVAIGLRSPKRGDSRTAARKRCAYAFERRRAGTAP